MRGIVCFTAAIAALASSAAATAKPAAFDIKHTTWTFTDKDRTRVIETIDADGNFIANSRAGKHLDHGTSVMKDGKACFTSAMTKEGEVCWTTPPHALPIGRSFLTKSDKGERLRVTRVAYKPLSMPK